MRFATVSGRALELAILLELGAGSVSFALEPESPPAPAIDRKALEEHVRFLSSEELGGRGNGSPGLEKGSLYIKERFEALNLEPAGDNGTYFQPFRLTIDQGIGRYTGAAIELSGSVRRLESGADFEPLTFSASGEVEAPIVFAGYGVTAPEHGYDDYAGMDVRGKLVLLLRYAPPSLGPKGWHATFVRKTENAASRGASGVLIVNGPRHHREDRLVPFGIDIRADKAAIPVVHLKREYGEALVASSGRNLLELQTAIDEDLAPRPFTIENALVSLTVDVRRTSATVANVLGFLPPLPAGAKGHIIIGAHYDHLGLGEKGSRDHRARGSVHNGADDNASGVAGVLELARAFSRAGDRPRGILFIAFAGEELGLKGSSHYVAHPALPLKDAVAMINLDMIGRLRHDLLYLGGVELLPELPRFVEARLEEERLAYSGRFTADEASDHASFVRAGVPALFFFTGLHGDYHKPTDDSHFINFEGMARVLRFGYRLSSDLLRLDSHAVLADPSRASGGSGQGSPLFYDRRRTAVFFGIGIDNRFSGEGIRFQYVATDGPAAKAGLRPGDVLLAIDGRPIGSEESAAVLLRQRRSGDAVTARIRRNDRILEITVRLATRP